MKKYMAIIAACLLLCSATSYSQSRILVYQPQADNEGNKLRDQLAALATSSIVELSSTLPVLAEYKAVFMLSTYHGYVAIEDQGALVAFLDAGGKLYIRHAGRDYSGQTPSEPLWDRVRDTSLAFLQTATPSTGAYGSTGTFTQGFVVLNPKYDPINPDVGSLGRAKGLVPVLVHSGQFNSESAWISPDTSLRFVLDFPQVQYHLDAFVAHVACNYFNLCQLDVESPGAQRLGLKYDPLLSEIHLPYQGDVVISDLLGRKVHTQVASGNRFALPQHLLSGTYLISWSHGEHHASIVIQHQ